MDNNDLGFDEGREPTTEEVELDLALVTATAHRRVVRRRAIVGAAGTALVAVLALVIANAADAGRKQIAATTTPSSSTSSLVTSTTMQLTQNSFRVQGGKIVQIDSGGDAVRTIVDESGKEVPTAGTGLTLTIVTYVPETKELVYTVGYGVCPGDNDEFRRIQVDGGSPKTMAHGTKPIVSPDGKYIAFLSGGCDVPGQFYVYNLQSQKQFEEDLYANGQQLIHADGFKFRPDGLLVVPFFVQVGPGSNDIQQGVHYFGIDPASGPYKESVD